ncbi:MAG TPA: dihydrofolate reductase family protein [Kofleriaceae bacterium]|jgi:dihydrofolate reductase
MSRLLVRCFSVSFDGFGAGPDQSLENPLGVDGPDIMQWFFPTRAFRAMQGADGGETGVDNSMAEKGFENIGAWIMGRNMFGPVRGPWPDDSWQGWWGEEPPYHGDVFVLTHHAREPLAMKGGTTFHFVTDGPRAALDRAKAAAGGKDVRIGGGVATVRAYFDAGLLDEAHFAMRPELLGRGEALFAGLDLRARGYRVAETVHGERATHVIVRR